MTGSVRRVLAPLVIALSLACQPEIWLSEGDGRIDLDAGHDAHVVVPPDANDASEVDARIEPDAAPPRRDCELASVMVAPVSDTVSLEAPTLATSGRTTTLRYGVLLPPSSSLTATDETRLVVLDDEGTLLHERTLRLDDASGAVTSTATVHSLSSLADDEGFLLLTAREVRVLDSSGEDASPAVALATAPSAAWQRAAGWIDADRFVFVSDTPDLLLAVFDRTTGEVASTPISALNAAGVHLDGGGVTITSAGPSSDIVVYDPDLSGTETFRTAWDDGTLLGSRFLGAGFVGGERTWVVRDASEFRTNITSYRISPPDAPVAGASTTLLGPLVATREGPFLAIRSANPTLALYAFETHAFSMLAMGFAGAPVVEDERDGANVAILFFEPADAGASSLTLACGRH
jgi:hypothetical protein